MQNQDFQGIVRIVTNSVLQPLVGLLIGAGLVYFLWGVLKYIRGDETAKKEAKSQMIYGIVALFVMVSVWGLVNVLAGTFKLENSIQFAPRFPGS